MSKVRVLIVDDNLVIRKGLKSLLEDEAGIVIEGEASTGAESIGWMEKSSADVVLMDIRMPGVDGIAATAEIMRIKPETKVLVVTGLEDPVMLAKALMAGARGCLIYNNFDPEELITAIREVAGGGSVLVSSSVALAMIELTATPSSEDRGANHWATQLPITAREEDILKLISEGKSNSEIAQILCIKEKTVKNHINSIYSKLRIKNRYEIISLKLRHEAEIVPYTDL